MKKSKKFKVPSLKYLTKRLEIRPLQKRDDRAWMASHCAMLPPRRPWEIQRVPVADLNFRAFMEVLKRQKDEIENDRKYTLGIFHKEIGTLLGYIYIQDIFRGEKSSAILDFRLINIYWGRGFAKEAVAETKAFEKILKLDKLQIHPKCLTRLKL